MSRRKGPELTDLQAAIVDYVTDPRGGGFGRPLAEVARELSSGGQVISAEEIEGWCVVAQGRVREKDPLGGEEDPERREAALEERFREAAEVVPGAADLLGMDRFRAAAAEAVAGSGGAPEVSEVVGKMLDFLVPEIASTEFVCVWGSVSVPVGGYWKVWTGEPVPGRRESVVMRSTLAVYDKGGALVGLYRWTRPRGRLQVRKRYQMLCVRKMRPVVSADLRAVAQRMVQVALEFRPGQHDAVSQKQLAELCGRTKQAISHQMKRIGERVIEATGGRAGFRRRRNLGG